ncbi:MAG: AAA family ATPase, partial [Candidatus Aminicenantaceae bacterium]
MKLIGLTGTNGSGKGEAALFFQKNGFAYFSLSDVIRDELNREGRPLSRDNLIQKGNQLRKDHGADVLARRVMAGIRSDAVIDSIRNLREVEYFRRRTGFILLALDAPPEIRFQRVRERGRRESAVTLEEFILKEREEMTEKKTGQQLALCMTAADYQIVNDGSLDDLHRHLEKFL